MLTLPENQIFLQTKIAIVFDFDDTLVPDSTIQFLESNNISRDEFIGAIQKNEEEDDHDPVFAYLNFILDEVAKGANGRLNGLKNQNLEEFGSSKVNNFFKGIPKIFEEIKKMEEAFSSEVKFGTNDNVDGKLNVCPKIEFYIVSGGLEPIVKASIISSGMEPYFRNRIVACRLGERDGRLAYIKRAVSFTEKTRYLYAINKGVFTDPNPYKVNEAIPPNKRPVPFRNMIYIGDGLTDIPCFSLLAHNGGTPIAVVPEIERFSDSYRKFVEQRRVNYFEKADYDYSSGDKDNLGALLIVLVKRIILDMSVRIKFYADYP